jgi:2-keto-4-pentenoate hydratase/2-oxohepta-3-ene-1,7-dioic acid hydratase in catechol pathway
MFVSVRVDGEDRAKGNLNGAAVSLGRAIASASRESGGVAAGEAFASDPFLELGRRKVERQIWPGALVEVEAEGIGILRNRIAQRQAPL